MSAEARMQPDAFEQLRTALEAHSWSHESLAEYVGLLAENRTEEEIFRRLAFRDGAAEEYEAMSTDDQARLRRWWHERARREAYSYEDLGARLSWRYMV